MMTIIKSISETLFKRLSFKRSAPMILWEEFFVKDQDLYYQFHIFGCTNSRPEGHKRGSCAARNAIALRNYMKVRTKELGIDSIRINAAGCLDRCELGPVMVVYPEGIWYRFDSEADIDEIIISHLQQGKPVERLRLTNDQK